MSCRTPAALFRWLTLLLGGILTAGPTFADAPEQTPLPQATSAAASSSPQGPKDPLERLSKIEQRLDWLMQQNDGGLRERKRLPDPILNDFRVFAAPGPEVQTSGALPDPASTGMTQFWDNGTEAFSSQGPGTESGRSGAITQPRGASGGSAPSAGGGSKASGGGDPTSIGRAQEVGNVHLGKVTFDSYYDFDDGGFHLASPDREFTFALRGMTQLDGMLYSRPTPGLQTSSGFYNPRSRIYFEGTVTEPISWEFSFQNFYDTVALLDAYVNFNYDPRFQVQIGRFKNPFGYEFYASTSGI